MPEYPIDLERLPALAAAQHDEFKVLRYQLEAIDHVSDEALDKWVNEIAMPIIEAIDCTACANCCRQLDVYLVPEDRERLAQVVPNVDDLLEYERAKHVGEWACIGEKPCPLLHNKRCSVYEHRPQSCRMYPQFTPDFRWVISDMLEGAGLCPIIYHTLVAIQARIDELYHD